MTDIEYRGVAKTKTLDQINTIVAQLEDTLGLLSVMGHSKDDPATGVDEAMTVLGFDISSRRPAKHAIIQTANDPAPANATKVCAGKIYILTTLTDCVAYRAN